MISERKAANALSGKTARPCDGCSRRRARWFCVADDAFLCQTCDESVHSANPLANRHERVRLDTSSSKPSDSWHQGFTKKARTPRHSNKSKNKVAMNNKNSNPLPLVPEFGKEESERDEDENDLIYRVPVFDFDPFAAQLLTPEIKVEKEARATVNGNEELEKIDDLDDLHGFLPSEADLAEFAEDVENHLEKGLDENYMNEEKFVNFVDKKLKDEQEMEEVIECHLDGVFGIEREPFEWNFDYESPVLAREDELDEEEKKVVDGNGDKIEMKKRQSNLLRLNYEAISDAWASHGSPWTTGNRPQLNLDDCLPHSMVYITSLY